MPSALIVGVSGTELNPAEASFLKSAQPCGLILFGRNLASHDQIRRLVADAKAAVATDQLLVLIDQEGGRVQRLRPPLGRALPPAAAYAHCHREDRATAVRSAHLAARLVARDLSDLGINCDCTPVLDVPVSGAHDIIGDRAYGATPAQVAELGRAVAEGFMQGGVLPVVKHIPGHGRATADSHLSLPVVTASRAELSATDFAPFRALCEMPAAMTAHVVFASIDPDNPASTSEIVTRDIIRGEIGFDGFLMSDDIGMRALSGSMDVRAAAVINAGSDVALHCSGNLAEMEAAASAVPALAGRALARFHTAFAVTERAEDLDVAVAEAALADVLAQYAARAESV